jgi:hypothetical protein
MNYLPMIMVHSSFSARTHLPQLAAISAEANLSLCSRAWIGNGVGIRNGSIEYQIPCTGLTIGRETGFYTVFSSAMAGGRVKSDAQCGGCTVHQPYTSRLVSPRLLASSPSDI